jgi:hypothetical protein
MHAGPTFAKTSPKIFRISSSGADGRFIKPKQEGPAAMERPTQRHQDREMQRERDLVGR